MNIKDLSETLPILDFEHTKEPMWEPDTGRNSNTHSFSGTFAGYFSQIVISFGKTTQEQMTRIKTLFEKATFTMTYPDSDTGEDYTEDFYPTAIKAKKDNWDGKYHPFSITLTGVDEKE
jgi:hypothetical protein